MAASRTSSLQKRVGSFRLRERIVGIPRSRRYKRSITWLRQRPFTAFLLSLALLFGIIALGAFLSSRNQKVEPKKQLTKSVQVYALSGSPTVNVQAKVDKAGVISIVSQTAGIVTGVTVKEGDIIMRGNTLVTLSSNYQGANAPALQAQIAQKQYNNTKETYDTQKDIIAKQREIAYKTETNAEELRKIAEDSANDTRGLVDLNQTILNTVNTNLTELQNTNTNGANDPLILQTQQLKSQVQSGVVQLQAQLRNLEYQQSNDKPPAELGRLQRDITKKQLEVQDKALGLGLEVSRLQNDLAWVQASLMTPSAPCKGTVERIYVKQGDAVNPGQVLATIKTDNNEATLEALVPLSIASGVSQTASSSAEIYGKTFRFTPYYISQEATSGQLYSVLFSVPEAMTNFVTDGQYLVITLPVGMTGSMIEPYVPLDAIYQTQNEAYLYTVQNNKAVSKKVSLGDVYGKFVVVTSGLSPQDKIILNRNVISGDTVQVSD